MSEPGVHLSTGPRFHFTTGKVQLNCPFRTGKKFLNRVIVEAVKGLTKVTFVYCSRLEVLRDMSASTAVGTDASFSQEDTPSAENEEDTEQNSNSWDSTQELTIANKKPENVFTVDEAIQDGFWSFSGPHHCVLWPAVGGRCHGTDDPSYFIPHIEVPVGPD